MGYNRVCQTFSSAKTHMLPIPSTIPSTHSLPFKDFSRSADGDCHCGSADLAGYVLARSESGGDEKVWGRRNRDSPPSVRLETGMEPCKEDAGGRVPVDCSWAEGCGSMRACLKQPGLTENALETGRRRPFVCLALANGAVRSRNVSRKRLGRAVPDRSAIRNQRRRVLFVRKS